MRNGKKKETPQVYVDCLTEDWHHGKITRFVKDEQSQNALKDVLRNSYHAFSLIFRRCVASSGPFSEILTIGMSQCMELLEKTGIADERTIRLGDSDTFYVASRVVQHNASRRPLLVKPNDQLLRFQFLEYLVRVAEARYFKTRETSTVADAVSQLFLTMSTYSDRLIEKQRKFQEALHTEACECLLRSYENQLRNVYRTKSGRSNRPGDEQKMSCREFSEVLAGGNIFNEHFPVRDATYAFLLATPLRADELYNLDFCFMSYIEFLHGLGAAAFLQDEAARGPMHVRLKFTLDGVISGTSTLAGLLSVLR